ncbi:hypothetical protein GSF08_04845 [Clostridiaceae bacterium DONG20-135]|uniref:Uncharacterized protein n=1 Tax=Copranaerobaculum intestinale TaxID=2692629 RepID=A0A6N8U960_9FIRM|nr:hypothetical protein [Copranaerobaculum intestinale]MXQ73263.1 hypothetical protein [Copranaerobaculum intestinale]
MKKETKRLLVIIYIAFVAGLTLLDLFRIMKIQMYFGIAIAILTLAASAAYIPSIFGRVPWYDQKQAEEQFKRPFLNYKTFLVLSLPLIVGFIILIYK